MQNLDVTACAARACLDPVGVGRCNTCASPPRHLRHEPNLRTICMTIVRENMCMIAPTPTSGQKKKSRACRPCLIYFFYTGTSPCASPDRMDILRSEAPAQERHASEWD